MHTLLRLIAGLVLLAIAVAHAVPVGAEDGVYSIAPIAHPAPAAPKLTAKAALVREDSEGRALFSKAPDAPLPPASTIKMLTALTALKLGQTTDTVTIIKDDLVGGSTMNLQAGDTLTLGSLLQGLLIPSGNDAAMAIARLEGTKLPAAARIGAVSAFVAKMNETGVTLGLTGTKAMNPHGLDEAGMVSTATDLARLAPLVLADPTLAPIVRTKETKAPSKFGSYPLVNTNEMLGTPGIIGVKTGSEDSVGQNLVLAVDEGNHRLIVTIIGSDDRYADARTLLAYVRANWAWVTLGDPKGIPGLARALTAWHVVPAPATATATAATTTTASTPDASAPLPSSSSPPPSGGRKTLLLDRVTRGQLHYRILLGGPGAFPDSTSAAAPGAITATASGASSLTASPIGMRGVIIYVLGDREVARLPLVDAPPPAPVMITPAPITAATAMPIRAVAATARP